MPSEGDKILVLSEYPLIDGDNEGFEVAGLLYLKSKVSPEVK